MMALEWAHGAATLISLGLTFPALAVCILVMRAWRGRYLEYCRSKTQDPSLMLIAGVYISFFGSMVDNSWWGVAWSLSYLEHPWEYFFFHNGVYPNIMFRQTTLIWAGLLHISAENMSRQTPYVRTEAKKTTRRKILLSVTLGAVYTLALVGTKALI